MQESDKKHIKRNTRLRSAKKDEDVKIVQKNTPCKADTLETDSDAERNDVKSSKQNITNSNDDSSKSRREVLAAKTCSSISQTEATVPHVEPHSNITSPHVVHKSSKKAADSEDVSESCQDSNSLLIAYEFPLIKKCSVLVCRIDTNLEPGGTFSVSSGGCRDIVRTPEQSSCTFKVYEDKPAPAKIKSADELSGLGKRRHRTRHSSSRCLNYKFTDVTEMDSMKDKPLMSLGINSSRGKSTEHSVSECCVSGEVNRSRPEDGIAIAGKEGTSKPQSMEEIDKQLKRVVEIGSQTEDIRINVHVTDQEGGTPPQILRERIMYWKNEYDELREFTTLEKQIYNPVLPKEEADLERQNRQLQKSLSDMKRKVYGVNCINSELHEEAKSLKERFAKETEKCNDMACRLQPAETAQSRVSQEVVDLKEQLDMAAQRIKHLENERNDSEMIQELAHARLKTRNKELTLSLEDAQMKLKELAHNAENLTSTSARYSDINKLQDELIILREQSANYIQEVKQKNEYIEQLKQENDKWKENATAILKNMQEEVILVQNNRVLYTEQLNVNYKNVEMYIKQLKELRYE